MQPGYRSRCAGRFLRGGCVTHTAGRAACGCGRSVYLGVEGEMNLGCFPLRLDLYLLLQLRATDAAAEPSTLLPAQIILIIWGKALSPPPLVKHPLPLPMKDFAFTPRSWSGCAALPFPLFFPALFWRQASDFGQKPAQPTEPWQCFLWD